MANNNRNQQQRQEQQRQQPFSAWNHPAQWGRSSTEEERNRYFQNDDEEEEGMSFGNSPQHQSRGISPSVIPWSPWSPPGRQSSSSLHAPLLSMSTPTHSRSFEYDYNEEEAEREEEEEGNHHTRSTSCCSRWCSFLCCCSSCCFRKASQSRASSRHQQQRQQPLPNSIGEEEEENEDSTGSGFCCKVMHLLLTGIMFGILFHISGKGNHQQWTMTAQESRHVATAGFGLTDTVQVVSHTPAYDSHKDTNVNQTTPSRGMAVYAMGNPHCPPLTGPRVVVDSPSEELLLFQHAWEYQFFYLNTGSTMQVTLTQTRGATNVLVLRGSKVLARIQDTRRFKGRKEEQEKPQSQYSDIALQFSAQQIMLERFSWTQEGSPIEFSFTSPASDVYVLLFDNAAKSEPATLQVKYHMELTTYNLDGLLPWCSHSALPSTEETTFTCPPLQVSKAGCILVEAVVSDSSNASNSTGSATDDAFFAMGQEVVQVTLLTTRKWIYIAVLSILPSLVIALYLRRRRKKKQRRQRRRYYRTLQQQQQQQQQQPQRHQQATTNLRSKSTAANTNTSSSRQLPPGAMFQFLPAHHQQDSDPEEEEVSEQRVAGSPNKNKADADEPPNRSTPSATETTMDNESTNGETTLIPAENVMVLSKDGTQESQDNGPSSFAE